VEVFSGVLVFSGIATADVPAGFAETQVNPTVMHFETFFAALGLGLGVMVLIEMGALSHVWFRPPFTLC